MSRISVQELLAAMRGRDSGWPNKLEQFCNSISSHSQANELNAVVEGLMEGCHYSLALVPQRQLVELTDSRPGDLHQRRLVWLLAKVGTQTGDMTAARVEYTKFQGAVLFGRPVLKSALEKLNREFPALQAD